MPMLPTLRTLLQLPDLGLTLLTPPGPTLDAPVQWAHSSDLADPTPFLSAGQLLLTTGTQFETTDPHVYVERLARHGIVGLAFGTEVISTTPPSLLAAAMRHSLPLIEVPYRTPFIAIARTTAELIAADAYERQAWSLSAQRAISLAALRPDGLRAALAELARTLGHGVALFDAAGELDRVFPADAIASDALRGVRRDVVRLLGRGQRAGANVEAGDAEFTLHTLGARRSLRGVLAVGGGAALDDAARGVVASVVGLASLALEQDHDQAAAVAGLRSGILRLLVEGEHELAARVGGELWGGMPRGRVRVAAVAVNPERVDALDDSLDARSRTVPERLFFGRSDDVQVIVLAPAARGLLTQIAADFDARIGLSDVVPIAEVRRGLEQARWALPAAGGGATDTGASGGAASGAAGSGLVAEFAAGVLDMLTAAPAAELARATLAPLIAHDAANGSSLTETVRAWLAADAQAERTAEALGVHRHTVRTRLATAASVLGRDLDRLAARAELWAAFTALDAREPGSPVG
jgi:purine catabolism regulator